MIRPGHRPAWIALLGGAVRISYNNHGSRVLVVRLERRDSTPAVLMLQCADAQSARRKLWELAA